MIVIAGPTGVGKSRLALALAQQLRGEIVNYDSVQIYRGFDIGSAKPNAEERAATPHHLYDIVEADDHFDAAEYSRLAQDVCRQIVGRSHRPILVGGTFFYLRAFLSGLPEMPPRDERLRSRLHRILSSPRGRHRLHRWLSKVDPASATRIDRNDRHRIERALEVFLTSGTPISSWQRPNPANAVIPHLKIALTMTRDKLKTVLDARIEQMYRDGLVEETRRLLERYSFQCRPFGAIGYREASRLLAGQINLEEAIAETKRRSHAYAKRQLTWLRTEYNVHWIDADEGAEAVSREAAAIISEQTTE